MILDQRQRQEMGQPYLENGSDVPAKIGIQIWKLWKHYIHSQWKGKGTLGDI